MRFLQTVVVVDDHAYKPVEVVEPEATLGDDDLAAGVDLREEPVLLVESPDPEDFETEVVVRGFADLGINCAVLAPAPGDREADLLRVERLARRSDIVILDWVLNPVNGRASSSESQDQTSIGFITGILAEDLQGGGRMRLVCVYTGASNGTAILDRIADAIEKLDCGAVQRRDGALDCGSTRVVVLGKERPVATQTIEVVASTALPNRVVDEFSDFAANGLLREVALDALSAVRGESHRLLRRFDRALDPALLSHRSATNSASADQFARDLVGSELASIVLSSPVTEAIGDDRVAVLVDELLADRMELYYWKSPAKEAAARLPRAEAETLLKLGVDEEGKISGFERRFEPSVSRTPLMLAGDEDSVRTEAREIDAAFSRLSSLARDPEFEGAGSMRPALQLGTVLALTGPSKDAVLGGLPPSPGGSGGGDGAAEATYWVCIQPVCDSVRLDRETIFPLLPLKPGTDSFSYFVHADGASLALRLGSTKIRDLALIGFTPDPATETVVAVWSGMGWEFRDSSGASYRWKGSLRLDKAHKLLQVVVAASARIGVQEYEYLRSWDKDLR